MDDGVDVGKRARDIGAVGDRSPYILGSGHS
jgi:hypothetical protein